LRGPQASKGQAFILILIVVVGLVLILGLLSSHSFRVRATPIVKEAFWLVDGQRATTAGLGDEVKAHVVIQATEEYVGSVVVKVRKDVRLWFDDDFSVSTVPVNLVGGEEKTVEIPFTPDEASKSGLTGLRGYFIEVEFRATRTSWVMENSYPPRLTVKA